jgi:membrane protein DedA with SNARE-associated domain
MNQEEGAVAVILGLFLWSSAMIWLGWTMGRQDGMQQVYTEQWKCATEVDKQVHCYKVQ